MTTIALTTTYNKLQNFCELASKISFVALAFAIPISVLATSITTATTVIFLILSGNFKEKLRIIANNKVAIIAIVLYLLFLIATTYSTATGPYVIKGLHKYGKLLFIPLFMPLMQEKKWQIAAINGFLAAMLLTLFISYLNLFHLMPFSFYRHGVQCPAEVFRGHIETSFFMAVAAFILAHRFFIGGRYRWLYGALFLLATYNTFFLNIARTGYVVYAGLILLLLWQQFSWKGVITAIVILPLLASALFVASHTFRTKTLQAHSDIKTYERNRRSYTSIGDRLGFIHHSLILIQHRPIFGYGTGSFKQEYAKNFPPAPGFPHGLTTPHDEYLLITVQLGIIGLAFYLWLLIAQWRTTFKLEQEIKPIAQAVIWAFFIGAFCNAMLYTTATGHFFVCFSAILWATLGKNKVTIQRHPEM